jgi:pyrroloquinoline quinone biosynthesis protein B
LRIRVLGSAAGGGFPQWNCNCAQCRSVRAGDHRFRSRTQASIAVTAGGGRFVVLNASPDIRAQLAGFDGLHPSGDAPRGTPLAAVLLTNADIDHIAGLLTLRESQPLALYATRFVRDAVVEYNAVFSSISVTPGQSSWTIVSTEERSKPVIGVGGEDTGLSFQAIAVPGKLPAYLEAHLRARGEGLGIVRADEETIAYRIKDRESGRSMVYAPGIKAFEPALLAAFEESECIFIDGTCFTDDELDTLGIAAKTSTAMGHAPISGLGGSLEALRAIRARKIFIHINNTNPILDELSSARRAVTEAGFEVAFDGMEVEV